MKNLAKFITDSFPSILTLVAMCLAGLWYLYTLDKRVSVLEYSFSVAFSQSEKQKESDDARFIRMEEKIDRILFYMNKNQQPTERQYL